MPPSEKGRIRRSQLITTYGVGSIVPVGDEAFMVADLDWGVETPDLHEPRLERLLNVEGFVQPPSADEHDGIPVVRFPAFQSCPGCHRLAPHGDFTHYDLNHCPDCQQPLVPSRFVVACRRGHIDDFPYLRWVHGGKPSASEHALTLRSSGTTATLAGVVIECSCGAERSMEDAFDRTALRDVTRCRGRHPWKGSGREDCSEVPRALQRGASSVWFADTRSALSIPPWSQAASRALDAYWATLRHAPQAALGPMLTSMKLGERTGLSVDDLVAVVQERKQRESGGGAAAPTLRQEEYEALVRGREQSVGDVDFATQSGQVPPALRRHVAQVQIATRLREVRALHGFTRIVPPRGMDGETSNVVPLRDGRPWLPAIEVKGEGLFVRLDGDAVGEWAREPEVRRRVALIAERDRQRHGAWGIAPSRRITGAFLLLHALAHALINELALDAGYPAASLRERLFAEDGQLGLLIYTATSDSAGSLGGIVSQGAPDRFEALVVDAIARSGWCSADPVCIESEASGIDSLNLAACHSCALLPETSCEEMNMFLDRALLVGAPGHPEVGFFSGLL